MVPAKPQPHSCHGERVPLQTLLIQNSHNEISALVYRNWTQPMLKRAGVGSSRPPENGFQVKIRLSCLNRELKFSELVGGVAEHRVFEDRRCFDGKRHRHSCVGHVFLSSDASQNMPGCSVAGQGPCREVLPGVLPGALPGACSWVFAAALLPFCFFAPLPAAFAPWFVVLCSCSHACALLLLFHVLWLCCAMIFLFLLFCFCPSASATCPCFSAHGLLLLLCCSCSSLSGLKFVWRTRIGS